MPLETDLDAIESSPGYLALDPAARVKALDSWKVAASDHYAAGDPDIKEATLKMADELLSSRGATVRARLPLDATGKLPALVPSWGEFLSSPQWAQVDPETKNKMRETWRKDKTSQLLQINPTETEATQFLLEDAVSVASLADDFDPEAFANRDPDDLLRPYEQEARANVAKAPGQVPLHPVEALKPIEQYLEKADQVYQDPADRVKARAMYGMNRQAVLDAMTSTLSGRVVDATPGVPMAGEELPGGIPQVSSAAFVFARAGKTDIPLEEVDAVAFTPERTNRYRSGGASTEPLLSSDPAVRATEETRVAKQLADSYLVSVDPELADKVKADPASPEAKALVEAYRDTLKSTLWVDGPNAKDDFEKVRVLGNGDVVWNPGWVQSASREEVEAAAKASGNPNALEAGLFARNIQAANYVAQIAALGRPWSADSAVLDDAFGKLPNAFRNFVLDRRESKDYTSGKINDADILAEWKEQGRLIPAFTSAVASSLTDFSRSAMTSVESVSSSILRGLGFDETAKVLADDVDTRVALSNEVAQLNAQAIATQGQRITSAVGAELPWLVVGLAAGRLAHAQRLSATSRALDTIREAATITARQGAVVNTIARNAALGSAATASAEALQSAGRATMRTYFGVQASRSAVDMYTSAYSAIKQRHLDMGASEEVAREHARTGAIIPSLAAGVVTGSLMKVMPGGTEAALRNLSLSQLSRKLGAEKLKTFLSSKEVLGGYAQSLARMFSGLSSAKRAAGGFVSGAVAEGIEEGLDEFIQSAIASGFDDTMTVEQMFSAAGEAALTGALIGGGTTGAAGLYSALAESRRQKEEAIRKQREDIARATRIDETINDLRKSGNPATADALDEAAREAAARIVEKEEALMQDEFNMIPVADAPGAYETVFSSEEEAEAFIAKARVQMKGLFALEIMGKTSAGVQVIATRKPEDIDSAFDTSEPPAVDDGETRSPEAVAAENEAAVALEAAFDAWADDPDVQRALQDLPPAKQEEIRKLRIGFSTETAPDIVPADIQDIAAPLWNRLTAAGRAKRAATRESKKSGKTASAPRETKPKEPGKTEVSLQEALAGLDADVQEINKADDVTPDIKDEITRLREAAIKIHEAYATPPPVVTASGTKMLRPAEALASNQKGNAIRFRNLIEHVRSGDTKQADKLRKDIRKAVGRMVNPPQLDADLFSSSYKRQITQRVTRANQRVFPASFSPSHVEQINKAMDAAEQVRDADTDEQSKAGTNDAIGAWVDALNAPGENTAQTIQAAARKLRARLNKKGATDAAKAVEDATEAIAPKQPRGGKPRGVNPPKAKVPKVPKEAKAPAAPEPEVTPTPAETKPLKELKSSVTEAPYPEIFRGKTERLLGSLDYLLSVGVLTPERFTTLVGDRGSAKGPDVWSQMTAEEQSYADQAARVPASVDFTKILGSLDIAYKKMREKMTAKALGNLTAPVRAALRSVMDLVDPAAAANLTDEVSPRIAFIALTEALGTRVYGIQQAAQNKWDRNDRFTQRVKTSVWNDIEPQVTARAQIDAMVWALANAWKATPASSGETREVFRAFIAELQPFYAQMHPKTEAVFDSPGAFATFALEAAAKDDVFHSRLGFLRASTADAAASASVNLTLGVNEIKLVDAAAREARRTEGLDEEITVEPEDEDEFGPQYSRPEAGLPADQAAKAQAARTQKEADALGLKDGDIASIDAALKSIAADKKSPLQKLARFLIDSKATAAVKRFVFVTDNDGAAGLFNVVDGTLTANLARPNPRGIADLVSHELVHALTDTLLRSKWPAGSAQEAAVKRLVSLQNAARKSMQDQVAGRDYTQLRETLSELSATLAQLTSLRAMHKQLRRAKLAGQSAAAMDYDPEMSESDLTDLYADHIDQTRGSYVLSNHIGDFAYALALDPKTMKPLTGPAYYSSGLSVEFVTHLLTDPRFQAFIDGIEQQGASVLSRAWNAVLSLFKAARPSAVDITYRDLAYLLNSPAMVDRATEAPPNVSGNVSAPPEVDAAKLDAALNEAGIESPVEVTPTVLRSLAGERAQLPQFMRDSLETAKAMAAAGKSSADIRAVTGWFPGKYDGKMRWEIPDNEVYAKNVMLAVGLNAPRFDAGLSVSVSLGELISHPILFEAYPELSTLPVIIRADGSVAAYTRGSPNGKTLGSIELGLGGSRQMSEASLSILLHEIQHAIQEWEGFHRGGSVRDMSQMPGFDAAVARAMGPEGTLPGDDLENARSLVAHSMYRRLAGEIEARDVQARMNYTPEQRAAIEPYSSENIAPEDAIVFLPDTRESRAAVITTADVIAKIRRGQRTPFVVINQAVDDATELRRRIEREAARRARPRNTGKSSILEQLAKARSSGRLSPEQVDKLIDAFNRVDEEIISSTSLSLRSKYRSPGTYNFAEDLITLLTRGDSPSRTGYHELSHNISRFIPDTELEKMREDYVKELESYLTKDPAFLAFVGRYYLTQEQYEDYARMALPGELDRLREETDDAGRTRWRIRFSSENYRYVMLDEWIAEKLADVFERKAEPPKTFFGKIARLFREIYDLVKAALGFDPYLRAYESAVTSGGNTIQRFTPAEVSPPALYDDGTQLGADGMTRLSSRAATVTGFDGIATLPLPADVLERIHSGTETEQDKELLRSYAPVIREFESHAFWSNDDWTAPLESRATEYTVTRRAFLSRLSAAAAALVVPGCNVQTLEDRIRSLASGIVSQTPAATKKLVADLAAKTTVAQVDTSGIAEGLERFTRQARGYASFPPDRVFETNVRASDGGYEKFSAQTAVDTASSIVTGLSDKLSEWQTAVNRIAGIVQDITGVYLDGAQLYLPGPEHDMVLEAAWRRDSVLFGAETDLTGKMYIHPAVLLGLVSTDARKRAQAASTVANELVAVAQIRNGLTETADKPIGVKIALPPIVDRSYTLRINSDYAGTDWPKAERESFDIAWVAAKAYTGSADPMVTTNEAAEFLSSSIKGFMRPDGLTDDRILEALVSRMAGNEVLYSRSAELPAARPPAWALDPLRRKLAGPGLNVDDEDVMTYLADQFEIAVNRPSHWKKTASSEEYSAVLWAANERIKQLIASTDPAAAPDIRQMQQIIRVGTAANSPIMFQGAQPTDVYKWTTSFGDHAKKPLPLLKKYGINVKSRIAGSEGFFTPGALETSAEFFDVDRAARLVYNLTRHDESLPPDWLLWVSASLSDKRFEQNTGLLKSTRLIGALKEFRAAIRARYPVVPNAVLDRMTQQQDMFKRIKNAVRLMSGLDLLDSIALKARLEDLADLMVDNGMPSGTEENFVTWFRRRIQNPSTSSLAMRQLADDVYHQIKEAFDAVPGMSPDLDLIGRGSEAFAFKDTANGYVYKLILPYFSGGAAGYGLELGEPTVSGDRLSLYPVTKKNPLGRSPLRSMLQQEHTSIPGLVDYEIVAMTEFGGLIAVQRLLPSNQYNESQHSVVRDTWIDRHPMALLDPDKIKSSYPEHTRRTPVLVRDSQGFHRVLFDIRGANVFEGNNVFLPFDVIHSAPVPEAALESDILQPAVEAIDTKLFSRPATFTESVKRYLFRRAPGSFSGSLPKSTANDELDLKWGFFYNATRYGGFGKKYFPSKQQFHADMNTVTGVMDRLLTNTVNAVKATNDPKVEDLVNTVLGSSDNLYDQKMHDAAMKSYGKTKSTAIRKLNQALQAAKSIGRDTPSGAKLVKDAFEQLKRTMEAANTILEADLDQAAKVAVDAFKVKQDAARAELAKTAPQALRAADQMRREIDRLSQKIIDAGGLGTRLETIIKRNEGVYLTRTYQIHDDPVYADMVLNRDPDMEAITRTARAYFVEQRMKSFAKAYKAANKGASDAAALAYAKRRMARDGEDLVTVEMNQFIKHHAKLSRGAASAGTLNKSILLERTDMPEPLRNLLGQTKNNIATAARTIYELGRYDANSRFLHNIHDMLMDAEETRFRRFAELEALGDRATPEQKAEMKELENVAYFTKDSNRAAKLGLELFTPPKLNMGKSTLGPLEGVYGPPALVMALREMTPQEAGKVMQMVQWAVGQSMTNLTVYSWRSQMRNMLSNTAWMVSLGHARFTGFGGLSKLSARAKEIFDTAASPEEAKNQLRTEMEQLGISGGSDWAVVMEDIRLLANSPVERSLQNIYENATARGLIKATGAFGKAAAKASKVAQGMYTWGDDIFKFMIFESELRDYMEAFGVVTDGNGGLIVPPSAVEEIIGAYGTGKVTPDRLKAIGSNRNELAKEVLRREAAAATRDSIAYYDTLPPVVTKFRRNLGILVAPFLSYRIAMPMAIIGNFKRAAKDMSIPQTRAKGARRLGASIATIAAYTWALETVFKMVYALAAGLGEDEDRTVAPIDAPIWSFSEKEFALRDVLGAYYKYRDVSYLGTNADGNPLYVDLSWLNPTSQLRDWVTPFLSPRAWRSKDDAWDAIKQSVARVAEPFYSPQILVSKMTEAIMKEDFDARFDTGLEKGFKGLAAAAEAVFVPGTVTDLRRAASALGTSRQAEELVSSFVGIKVKSVDVEEKLRRDFRAAQQADIDATKEFRRLKSVETFDNVQDLYDQVMERKKKNFQQVRDAYVAGQLFLGEDRARRILRDRENGLESNVARDIDRGIISPYVPGAVTFDSMAVADRKFGTNRVAQVREAIDNQEPVPLD